MCVLEGEDGGRSSVAHGAGDVTYGVVLERELQESAGVGGDALYFWVLRDGSGFFAAFVSRLWSGEGG